jgi:hypothetical protein
MFESAVAESTQNVNQSKSSDLQVYSDFVVPCLYDAIRQSYGAMIFEIQSLLLYATRNVMVYQQRPTKDVSVLAIAQRR